MRGNPGVGGSC